MSTSASTPLDVAIVGAGAAGLYCGWRLLCDSPEGQQPPAVTIFEADGRVGGRVASFTAPDMPHVVGELGAMQFLSTQKLIYSLIKNRLWLEIDKLYLSKPVDQLLPDDIFYLRGRHMRGSEVSTGRDLPYNLTWTERGRDPLYLLRDALEQVLPGVTRRRGEKLEAFLRTAQVAGKPLYQWGFWNLLGRVLSNEACMLIRDSLGYNFFLNNYNAVAMIREVQVLFPKITYYWIPSGYDKLPLTMAGQFAEAGGRLLTGHRLTRFEPAVLDDGSEGYKLTFQVGVPGSGRRQRGLGGLEAAAAAGAGVELEVYARTLVLALPRRALELVERQWPAPSAPAGGRRWPIDQLLTMVSPVSMVKVFLCYPSPWWRAVAKDGGQVFTDLPVELCTYWGVEGESGGPKSNTSALAMAVLADSLEASFWEGLLGEPPPPAARHNVVSGASISAPPAPGSPNWEDHKVPVDSPIVRETHRQLLEIHGVREAPEPYAAAVIDWAVDPYGGAAHYWQHHINPWLEAAHVLQPVAGRRVFICGEAYSNEQGWVEGALRSAEAVLQHHDFPHRLPEPPWLDPDGEEEA